MRRIPPRPSHITAAFTLRALAILAALGGCRDDSASLAACSPDPDGVAVVASRGEGVWAGEGRRPRLVELWRVGGLNEGEELAYPVSLSASRDGRVAITDFQLSEVIVIEPDGTWRGAWARRGQGPGELATPVTAAWAPNGTLAIFDIAGPKVLFIADGDPVRDDVPVAPELAFAIINAGSLPWVGVQPQGAILLQPPSGMDGGGSEPSRRTTHLLRLRPGENEPDTLARAMTPAESSVGDFTAPGWPRLVAAIGVDGAIAVGGLDSRYRITVYDAAGAPVRQICRATVPLPLTAGERGDTGDPDLPPDLVAGLRAAPQPDTLASFGRLFWDAGGRLWVQRNRPSPFSDEHFGVPGALYDVFDATGRYLGEVTAPAAARLQSAAGDTVWAFETGELDETSVVAYGLTFE